jgi:hypothetical protein
LNDVERSISRVVKLDPGAEIMTPVGGVGGEREGGRGGGGEGEREVWWVEDRGDEEGEHIDVGVVRREKCLDRV